ARSGGIPQPLWRARAQPLPRRPSLRAERRRRGSCRALRAGGVAQRPLRRQLQLARPNLVPGQLPADRVAATLPPLLRRRLHDRMPDRLWPVYDARRGRRRTLAAPDPALHPRRGGPPRRLRRRRPLPERPALARLPTLL